MLILLFAFYSFVLLLLFYLLAKVCDQYFVGSLEIISDKLKLRSDVAGATFMAIGSSAPELFTSIFALIIPGSHEQIGAGTIVGSAIFNMLIIIGASCIVATAHLKWQPVVRDMLFYFLSIMILLITFQDGIITVFESTVFVLFYIFYVFMVFNWKRILPYKDFDILKEVDQGAEKQEDKIAKIPFVGWFFHKIDIAFGYIIDNPLHKPEKYFSIFIWSIVFIGGFSWMMVEIAVEIAHILHISDSIVALTVLAMGTSVPDLLSSIIVSKKGYGGMAISNAVGSNIFDILFGLGFPWLIYTLVYGQVVVSTQNLTSSIFLLLATIVVVVVLMLMQHWKLNKKAGYILITAYIAYILSILYSTVIFS